MPVDSDTPLRNRLKIRWIIFRLKKVNGVVRNGLTFHQAVNSLHPKLSSVQRWQRESLFGLSSATAGKPTNLF